MTSISLLPIMLAAGLLAAAPAKAELGAGKLQVSAQVVVSCRLDASVPRIGAPGRAAGTAAFSVTCTRGLRANATLCAAACASADTSDSHRTQLHIAENRGTGTAIATLLF